MAMQSKEAAATTIAKPPVKYIHPAQVSPDAADALHSCVDIFHTDYSVLELIRERLPALLPSYSRALLGLCCHILGRG